MTFMDRARSQMGEVGALDVFRAGLDVGPDLHRVPSVLSSFQIGSRLTAAVCLRRALH